MRVKPNLVTSWNDSCCLCSVVYSLSLYFEENTVKYLDNQLHVSTFLQTTSVEIVYPICYITFSFCPRLYGVVGMMACKNGFGNNGSIAWRNFAASWNVFSVELANHYKWYMSDVSLAVTTDRPLDGVCQLNKWYEWEVSLAVKSTDKSSLFSPSWMNGSVNAIVEKLTLRWRYNGHDSVSNHQPHDYLRNRLFRRR